MEQQLFVTADMIAQELGVSKSLGYKLIYEMNQKLKEQGFMVIAGRVSRKYYEQCFFGFEKVENDNVNMEQ